MKKNLLLLLFCLTLGSSAMAQVKYPLPDHPLKADDRIRIKADTMSMLEYYSNTPYPRGEGAYYSRNPNGLIDTVIYVSGIAIIVTEHYNEKDQLITIKYYDSNGKDAIKQSMEINYERDSNNVIFHEKWKTFYYSSYDYPMGEPDSIKVTYEKILDYSQIIPNDSGYTYLDTRYVLDDQKRLISTGLISNPTSYSYYSYTDSGYSDYSNKYKSDHLFYENGYQKSIKKYSKKWDNTWTFISEEVYTYSNKDSDPLSNNEVQLSTTKVYGINGAIVVEADLPVQLRIYTITGHLVLQQTVQAGSSQLSIGKGLYFVQCGNESFKVLVR